MDKRLLLVGIVLIIIGVAISASYASQNLSSLATGSRSQLAIAPNSVVYSSFTLNDTDLAYVVYNSNQQPIDFYLVNSSAFAVLQPYINSSSFPSNVIAGLEGDGLYVEINNSTKGIFPYNSSLQADGFSAPSYMDNNSIVLSKGTYYMIYRNPGPITANTSYGYVMPNGALIDSSAEISTSKLAIEGGVSALFVLAGIVLVIYALISSGKEGGTAAKREEEIADIYKQIEKKEKSKTHKKKKD